MRFPAYSKCLSIIWKEDISPALWLKAPSQLSLLRTCYSQEGAICPPLPTSGRTEMKGIKGLPAPYHGGIVVLVKLDDLQVQNELGKHQEGIQNDQANDDNLQTKGRIEKP